jgi:hypothetical protein
MDAVENATAAPVRQGRHAAAGLAYAIAEVALVMLLEHGSAEAGLPMR